MEDVRWMMDSELCSPEHPRSARRCKNEKLATAAAFVVCLAASVLLVGFSGTAAVGIVAWLRADG